MQLVYLYVLSIKNIMNVLNSKYIYVIYRLRGPDEKNCARGLENGLSPKGEGRFKTEGTVFLIWTEAAGK